MHNQSPSLFTLATIGSACIFGLLIRRLDTGTGNSRVVARRTDGVAIHGCLNSFRNETWTTHGQPPAARGVVPWRADRVAQWPADLRAEWPPAGLMAGPPHAARQGNVAVRPGYRPPGAAGGWYRPSSYWWRPGAAVAAGAALGFVTAAAATAYVTSPPPAAGSCWYYTNAQRTQGFWDACPQ